MTDDVSDLRYKGLCHSFLEEKQGGVGLKGSNNRGSWEPAEGHTLQAVMGTKASTGISKLCPTEWEGPRGS